MPWSSNKNTIWIKYIKEQRHALAQLRRAWKKVHSAKLSVFNQYGTLQFYPDGDIDHIGCEDGDIDQNDVVFEELNINVGEFSDDTHWVQFSEKGKKKYLEMEEQDGDV